jgi:hypothetical protein
VALPAAYCGTEPAVHVQAASAGEPANDVEPSGHDRQEVPSAAAYVLAWHGLHVSAPRAEKEPGQQASHTPEVEFRNEPALQGKQPVPSGRL